MRAGALLLDPLRAALPLHAVGRAPDQGALAIQPTDDVAWARGAASLILRELFRLPIFEGDEELTIDRLLARRAAGRRRKGVIARRA